MDFSKIKEWFITEGKVKSVSVGGVVLWQAKSEQKQLTAPTIHIEGDEICIHETNTRTEQYVVFVDGVEMKTIQVRNHDGGEVG